MAIRGSIFLRALTAIVMLQIAWATTLPLFRGPDEIPHVYRATAVALGQWIPDDSVPMESRVPADVVSSAADTCHQLYDQYHPEVCEPVPHNDSETVSIVGPPAHMYNPLYYSAVGLPVLVLSGEASVWTMRAVSAAITAILLACAWWVTATSSRSWWNQISLLTALTPAVVFSTTVVAPNGVQFVAAILLWSGLLAVRRQPESARPAALATGVGGSLLVTTHTTGPMWLAAIAVVALVLFGWREVHRLWRQHPTLWTSVAATVTAMSLASVGWTLRFSSNIPVSGGDPLADETKSIGMFGHVLLWVFQTIGVFPNRFGVLWPFIYALWLIPIFGLLVWAFRRSSTRSRAALMTALTISAAIPAVLTALTYDALGVAWQGRYGLPLLVGVLLIAGDGLDRRGVILPRIVCLGLGGLLSTTQLLAILCLGLREASGPFDDGRPWGHLLFVGAPILIAAAYAMLGLAAGRTQTAKPVLLRG